MCGIIGYIGKEEAKPIILNGLRRLEYRGYDSSGIALVGKEGIFLCKAPGKLTVLNNLLTQEIPSARLGIGHVRWATHGEVNEINAHPHLDCKGEIAVVHNGIIENYHLLKEKLIKEGHLFLSQTDTEVIAHLVEKYYHGNLEEAVRKALKELKGAYSLGIISQREPEKLIGVRLGSPLIVGTGKNGNFIASDIPAILDYTNLVFYLNDQEMAIITEKQIEIKDFQGRLLKRKVNKIEWDISLAEKNGHPHFMLKEIYEQPWVLNQICRRRIYEEKILWEEMGFSDKELLGFKKIFIVACGTAYHAGLVGKYILEELAGIPVEVEVSSEFRYRYPLLDKNTLILAISQSGETADTLACIREAKQKQIRVISICNVLGSSIARESDGVIYTHAGPEIGVASTKAYTAQLGILYLFAFYLAGLKKKIAEEKLSHLIGEFKNLPLHMETLLKDEGEIKKIARRFFSANCFLYLARGRDFPNALEGALKLKEISYIHAEGYPAGEMKHGPIALIDENMPVVCIVPQGKLYEKMFSNIQEVRARKGKVIALATQGDEIIKAHADEIISLPKIDELFTPFLTVLPLQLLAYHIAVLRNCDIDQPRNLAKSVTVE
ncbi:MAG: glutamine--fructose-6-phosphate transaminase (isomerizing) [Candidatus Omnitrophica bacterium]|nr:glutamine--fructose-6-phosphate transaminase (isomerizing) [Candidatus Omnitrophota bacterium]MCM8792853.1 glutamine--fructose-6-phosphate transaminase (isomerizing) [Candidatus Omnitrophota bacterium]